MWSSCVLASVLSTFLFSVNAAPDHYEVKSLPGWHKNGGKLVSRMWSGFASGGTPPNGKGDMMFNYVFIEAETKDPENAPVVIWYDSLKIICHIALQTCVYACIFHKYVKSQCRRCFITCLGTMADLVQPACLVFLWSWVHIT